MSDSFYLNISGERATDTIDCKNRKYVLICKIYFRMHVKENNFEQKNTHVIEINGFIEQNC